MDMCTRVATTTPLNPPAEGRGYEKARKGIILKDKNYGY